MIGFPKILILIPVLSVFLSANAVFAAETKLTYPWSGATTPADFVNQFYIIALGFVGAAAFAVIIYGAILYTVSAGNTSRQGEARGWITGAIWGIALLLGAYLILYTINPNLVNLTNPGLEPIGGKATDASQPIVGDVTGTTGSFGPNSRLPDADARAFLTGREIGVKSPCLSGQTVNCADLTGIRFTTLDEVRVLASRSSADIFVTAGTDCASTAHNSGNTSHCSGYKVDLRATSNLNDYIEKNFAYIGQRSDGAPMYTPSWDKNTIYAREYKGIQGKDHWDIRVTRNTILGS